MSACHDMCDVAWDRFPPVTRHGRTARAGGKGGRHERMARADGMDANGTDGQRGTDGAGGWQVDGAGG